MQKYVLAAATLITLSSHAPAAEVILSGTYKQTGTQRTIVDTGEVISSTSTISYLSYSTDGRMMVVAVRNPRPKPESTAKITDQEQRDLYRTVNAYAGTYKFDGTTIEHNVEISSNEVWSGTKQVRTLKKEGDRLVITTPPLLFPDGRMSINTTFWEKLN